MNELHKDKVGMHTIAMLQTVYYKIIIKCLLVTSYVGYIYIYIYIFGWEGKYYYIQYNEEEKK